MIIVNKPEVFVEGATAVVGKYKALGLAEDGARFYLGQSSIVSIGKVACCVDSCSISP